MKILYHHRTVSADGQAVHIDEMIAALRLHGHEVRIVAPASGSSREMGDEVGWIHRLKNALPNALYEMLELAYSIIAFKKLRTAARDFEPDFIYERYNLFLLAGVMVKRFLNIPLLLEVNSPLVLERSRHSGGLALHRLATWAEGKIWRNADFVLPVTHVLAEHVAAYGVPKERIVVIPNGINEAHFLVAPDREIAKRKLGLEDALILGFAGFVREWHGVDRVIRWMACSQAPKNVFLLIVGDGPERLKLEAMAQTLLLTDRVRFTGIVDRDRVPEYVSAFDIALQPAVTSYASPLKMMEYLVLGKAIVAPRERNLLEVLVDDQNALLFDSQDALGFEKALQQLCNDKAMRDRLSVNARETIRIRDLTWNGNAIKVANLGKLCMNRPRFDRGTNS